MTAYFDRPDVRVRVLEYYTMGMSTLDICQLMGKSNTTALRAAMKRDREFGRQCTEAMEIPFRPVLLHATHLAMQADSDGDREGAHKALALVMKYHTRRQDRIIEVDTSKAAMALAAANATAGRAAVLGPAGVADLLRRVRNDDDEDGAIEVQGRPAELGPGKDEDRD